ncbi:protein phosphatase CheZ [Parvibium lacunae]|nr:protein phosphatase CheZ [Parvibium lacunae]
MANDPDDLEALFDQISSQRVAEEKSKEAPAASAAQTAAAPANAQDVKAQYDQVKDAYDIFQRVGTLTRNLHDALRELGYDKKLDSAVGSLPDARARLTYIANLTGQAAEKSLSCVEKGQDTAGKLEADAVNLRDRWEKLYAKQLSVDEFKALAGDTRGFLQKLPETSGQFNGLFLDIMMAQDFHDLTGQVINKIVNIAQTLEESLVKLLLDATPPEKRVDAADSWLNGPVINAQGRTDVVSNQEQVDDLLASLGF